MAMADTRPAPTSEVVDLDGTDVELAAERRLVHQVILGAAIAVPIGVIVCVGLVFAAVRIAGVPGGGPELMAVCVGVLFGLFFGALSGFVKSSGELDAIDPHTAPVPGVGNAV
jgi:hypothetical protein